MDKSELKGCGLIIVLILGIILFGYDLHRHQQEGSAIISSREETVVTVRAKDIVARNHAGAYCVIIDDTGVLYCVPNIFYTEVELGDKIKVERVTDGNGITRRSFHKIGKED